MADVPLTELVISPRWAATVGEIDGTTHVVLRIQHPRLGPLDFLLPANDPIELAAALEKTWERRDEARMRNNVPQLGSAAEMRQPKRHWWSRLFRTERPSLTSKFVTRRARGAKQSEGSGKQSA
jgi:hypothetical protein